MASGTITGTSNSYVYLKISWSSTAGTGGSTVKASLIAQNGTNAYWYATINADYYVKIDGTTTTSNGSKLSSTKGGSSTLMTASKWVAYTGEKSITISGYANFNEVTIQSTGASLGTRSVSGTAKLDKVGSIPPVPTMTAPSTSTISETATSIAVSWNKSADYSGAATYTLQVSKNGGAWSNVATSIANGTTSRSYTITAGQGNTYKFRVCATNDVGSSSYSESGTVTTNKLNTPTIGTINTYNPYVNSALIVPLDGGSQTNGGAFTRRADLYYGDTLLANCGATSNDNTSAVITYSAANYVSKLGSAYSGTFKIVAWIQNANGSRSGYVSKTFTVNINSDGGATPTISASTIGGGSLGYPTTCFIAGISTLSVTVGSIGLRRGATSYNWKIDVTGYSSATTSPKTYSNLTYGIKDIKVTVTDNRGLSASTTTQIMVQAYAPPTIRNISGVRLSSPNTSAKVTYEPYYTPIFDYSAGVNTKGSDRNGINSQQYSVDGGSWASCSKEFTATGLSTGSTHTIKVRIADKVKTSSYTESEVLIPTIVVPLAFRKSGIGINCIPTTGYALDVNGVVRIGSDSGNITVDDGTIRTTGKVIASNIGAQISEVYFATNTTDSMYVRNRTVVKVIIALNGSLGYVEDTLYINNGKIISTKRGGTVTSSDYVTYSYDGDTQLLTITCNCNWSAGYAIAGI